MSQAVAIQQTRERILESAYELFSRRGVKDVGIDELIEHASVAKATLYRHFPSKDELALAFLEQREERWTYGWVEREARRRRGRAREGALLAIFDLFDEWFHRDDYEGCAFLTVLLETADLRHPLGAASARHLENLRAVVRVLAVEAGLHDVEQFALAFHVLVNGAIVQASEGDLDAARRAQGLARLLIEQYSGDRGKTTRPARLR
jgi:AcrR family transcriptional regulator